MQNSVKDTNFIIGRQRNETLFIFVSLGLVASPIWPCRFLRSFSCFLLE